MTKQRKQHNRETTPEKIVPESGPKFGVISTSGVRDNSGATFSLPPTETKIIAPAQKKDGSELSKEDLEKLELTKQKEVQRKAFGSRKP